MPSATLPRHAMIESASGLVVRVRPLTETSLIVHWLTPKLGRIATVAKGAKRPKSPFRGKLDLFYLADFSFSRSQRSELHTLREVVVRNTHAPLRTELGHLQQASYCAALIEKNTETETPIEPFFDLLAGFLDTLPLAPPQAQKVLAFELKLLQELGLAPDTAHTRLTPGSKAIANFLTQGDWQAIAQLKLSAAQMDEVQAFLKNFLLDHLGGVVSSREAALNAQPVRL